jgi:hypothetical protein
MNEQKKAIDMTPEELNEWLASLPAPEEDDYPHFPDADPYFELEHNTDGQRSNCWFGKDGQLTVHNYCAAQLPQITVTLQSGQTTYRFNGSYDGTRSLSGKLLDRMVKDSEEFEN